MKKKILAALVCLVMASLCMAGCGSEQAGERQKGKNSFHSVHRDSSLSSSFLPVGIIIDLRKTLRKPPGGI